MAGTYFDGDTVGPYYWTGVSNLSSSYNAAAATTTNSASIGDLIGGSWSIEESTTPLDIMDTSGSTGGVTASFKRNSQGVAATPTTTPAASSSYLQGQACSVKHPLGTINGYITSVSPDGGTVKIEQSTPLSALNINMTMPPYVDGSMFYSFTLRDSTGTRMAFNDMVVLPDGNLLFTGNNTGANATVVYDRFGNYVRGITHSASGIAVDYDASGRIYVLHSTSVERFNADGTGATTLISSLTGGGLKMRIDRNNGNIWIATKDTTTNQAIKCFLSNGSLTFQTNTFTFSSTYSTNTTYNSLYTGMAFDQINQVLYVGSSAVDSNGVIQCWYNKIASSTGITTGPFQIGSTSTEILYSGVGMDISQHFGTGKAVFFSRFGVYDTDGHMLNSSLKVTNWPDGPNYGLIDSHATLAVDAIGGGMFALNAGTIYRISSGDLSVNQAIECYLGAAGYRGTISYGATLNYHQDAGINSIPMPYGVAFPGWTGNVWTKLKELCARTKRQITTDGIGIRINRTDLRNDLAKLDITKRKAAPQVTEGQPGAQVINVTSQNVTVPNTSSHGGLIYASTVNDNLLTTDASGASSITLQLGVHAAGIDQPNAYTPAYYNQSTFNFSTYAIADSSNPPQQVDSAAWTLAGGSLRYSVNPDTPGAIDMTLVGPTNLVGYTGPFSVAFVSGTQKLPFFTISGYGLSTNPQTFQVYTGAPIPVAAEIDSQNLDSVFLDSTSVAYDMARQSATVLGSGELSIGLSIPVSALTVGFGSIAGSYFYWNRNNWRVVDATVSGGWVDITAVRDTRIFDVQDGSITHASIDTTWSGYRYIDNYLSPGILGAS